MSNTNEILNAELLKSVPTSLRDELLAEYAEMLKNFREERWEPAELNGGKLCEVVYTILRGHVDGKYPAKAKKPANMVDACRALEKEPDPPFTRSVRIQLPRMLMALYEVRNNRGVGHVGGDVNPNRMDAICVLEMSKWVLCELVRIFHDVTTEVATDAVASLMERNLPLIWSVGGKLPVLEPKRSMKDKSLALLYHSVGPVAEALLFGWTEHSNASAFRRDVLRPAHKQKLIEYDQASAMVHLSPMGIEYVEDTVLAPKPGV